jgi:hypothetical protein
MADVRDCEQCGTAFAPRREHARFCSVGCRMAWNREHATDAAAAAAALGWSVAAMTEATERVARAAELDLPHAVAVISEAVWWITIVDATLVRYHEDTYDDMLAGQPLPRQQLTEETLAGLRFVRNQMGYRLDPAGFIQAAPRRPGDGGTAWIWNPVPEPQFASLSSRGREWEVTRYRAYKARLAGRDVVETFELATGFLVQVCENATAMSSARSARNVSGYGMP